MPSYLRYLFAGIIVALLIGTPLGYLRWRTVNLRNIHVVKDGVLYRSGQLSMNGLKRVLHDYQIKTVVTFRSAADPNTPHPDHVEEDFVRGSQLNYFRLPHKEWEIENGSSPADENVAKFLAIMNDPANHPVLVHCFAGIHRTGAYCALYRMEVDGWSAARAMDEMRACGYRQIDSAQEDCHRDVRRYLESYQRKGFAQATPAP